MKRRDVSGKTLQDIGIVVMLAALLIVSIVCAISGEELLNENIIMTVITFVAVILAAFRVTSFSVIVASIQTMSYMGYKAYSMFVLNNEINYASYFFIVVPGLAVAGMLLFVKGVNRLQRDNNILSNQVEELIMINPLTGLYNLRSMYMDIQTQISYAERTNKNICLMILRPRYKKELKEVLNKSQFEEAVVKLSKYVYDTVRLEDRVYSLDNDGTLGVLLTCNRNGAKLVEKRLREKIDNPEAFTDIAERPLRMEIQLGCLEYKQDYNRDAILFKSRVEEEVAYDL